MKAIQIAEPGKILMLDDAPTPEPADGQVLVRCTHVALCGSNMGQYTGEGLWADIEFPNPVGWAGHENIGIIEKSRCDGWQEGQLVLAQPEGYFGFAEYIVSRPPAIALLPKDTPDPAGLIVAQPLATVLRAMERAGDVINKSCAVVGQGPMGLIFTHVLRMLGASRVYAVDILDWRLDWAKHYKADHVIDASKTDPVKVVTDLTGGKMVDFVVEAVGYPDSLATAAKLTARQGRMFMFGMPHYQVQEFPFYHCFRQEVQIQTCVGPECGAFFQTAADMVLDDRAKVLTDMVTPIMPWEKAPEAFEMYAKCVRDSLKLTLTV